MEAERWGVWCQVWGGVTGRREAWLKHDDKVWIGTKEEAEAEAKTLNRIRYNTLANFKYTAMKYDY